MSRLETIEDSNGVSEAKTEKAKAFIAFVVDESGSMGAGREATVRGMNEQIQMIRNKFKDSKDVQPIVTVVKFNEHTNPLFVNKPLDQLIEFTDDSYIPNGGTAMYDAIGFVLNQLESAPGINDEDTSVLVVVVSDGEENSSKEHNSQSIANRVKTFNETKRWTFTYLGANQDLTVVQQKTNIHSGNLRSFISANNQTYGYAFAAQNVAMDSYLNDVSVSAMQEVSETGTLLKSRKAYASSAFYAGLKDESKGNEAIGQSNNASAKTSL